MRPTFLLALAALSLIGAAHARPADPKPAPVAPLVQRDAFPRPALMLKEMSDPLFPTTLTTAQDGSSLPITSVAFGTSADTSFLKGSGAAVGKPVPGSITIKRAPDRASPIFWTKLVQGASIPKLVIGFGGGIVLTLESVFVTNIQMSNDQGNPPTESISVVFKTIRYEVQDTSGKGRPTGFTWDVAAMKLTPI